MPETQRARQRQRPGRPAGCPLRKCRRASRRSGECFSNVPSPSRSAPLTKLRWLLPSIARACSTPCSNCACSSSLSLRSVAYVIFSFGRSMVSVMGVGLPPVVGSKSTTGVARVLKALRWPRVAAVPRPTRIPAKLGSKRAAPSPQSRQIPRPTRIRAKFGSKTALESRSAPRANSGPKLDLSCHHVVKIAPHANSGPETGLHEPKP